MPQSHYWIYSRSAPGRPETSLKTGYDLEVYLDIDDTEYLMGTYDIDTATDDQDQEGQSGQIMAKAKGSRRLNQWASDTDYDYWSQTKQTSRVPQLLV